MINTYERMGGLDGAAAATASGGGVGGASSLVLGRRDLVGSPHARAGMRYERIMFTRLEMECARTSALLLDPKYLWVPTGEDNTGVNDRHWLANRADAEGIFRRWDALVSGAFHEIFFATSMVRPAFMSSET